MQSAGDKTNHHATKDAGLQRLNAKGHSLPHGTWIFQRELARQNQQRIDGGIHHQKREQSCKPSRAFVRFCQTNRDANRKQHRQVCKNNRTRAAHNGENGLQPADIQKRIGRKRVRI
ncbi:hypothetical protein D3C80_1362440 [compost metagenome]